jgi:hypothetical protein
MLGKSPHLVNVNKPDKHVDMWKNDKTLKA